MLSAPLTLLRDDDLPETLPEFARRYSTETACAALLRRWKYGNRHFICPRCGGTKSWYIVSRRVDECATCHKQVSLTAGTVMHGSRKPLRTWFLAMYEFVFSKQGVSALELSRKLGLAYPTAWTWLHKLRTAVGTRPKTPLEGTVEVDETWEGGLHEGRKGRPFVGEKKALIAGAIEVKAASWGRVRLNSVDSGSSKSLGAFLFEHVAPGSILYTDDWRSYRQPARQGGYEHRPVNVTKSSKKAHEIMPAIHRVFSLVHRMLLTTYQGAVRRKHLQNYLEEYEFRFNRRTAESRALLFQRLLTFGVRRRPPYYWEIIERPDGKTPLWAA